MPSLAQLKKELKKLSNPKQAKILQRFFKTKKGEYGEGDIFLGVSVPKQRKTANKFQTLPLEDLEELLNSKIHEHRMTALFILIKQYEKAGEREKKAIFDFYLKNTKNINNWDLVDISAPKIIGDYLLKKPRTVLYKLVKSKNLWKKRIAILSTFSFIRNNEFDETLKISEMLLSDERDLIHKAVGWMLREIGKRDQKTEEKFLKKHYLQMPRTMLRYSIERFDEKKRKFYLFKKKGIMDNFFSKKFYEIWLKQTMPEIKEWFSKEIQFLKENIKPDSKILDVGCGFGRHMKILANFSKEVVGIDDNDNMIKKAKDRFSNFKNVKLFLQNAQKLNFEDEYFDYVICMTNTFGNVLKTKINVLKEMKRVCRKGGKIIISVYSDKSFKIRKKSYEKIGLHITKVEDRIVYTKEGLISEYFTEQQLEKIFNLAGLKVKIIKPNSISYICEAVKR